MGIDAYEFYEDTKELFLIQNKYYTDKTKLNINYVKNDFLLNEDEKNIDKRFEEIAKKIIGEKNG